MTKLGEPFTQEEILKAMGEEITAVYDFFRGIAEDKFYDAPAEVWSAADNLVHLIKSCKPVAQGLNAPKLALRMRFGMAEHASKTFAALRAQYVDVALAGGAEAGGPYLPEVKEKTAVERERILNKWQSVGQDLVKGIGKWSENDLEKYQVQHPLLGDMTVREIIFFTLYHNMHHVNDTQRLLGLEESEWFMT